jgi:hypothetical protein
MVSMIMLSARLYFLLVLAVSCCAAAALVVIASAVYQAHFNDIRSPGSAELC